VKKSIKFFFSYYMKRIKGRRYVMRRIGTIFLAFILIGFGVSGASAATIDLFEWAFNTDGSTAYMPVLPGTIDSVSGLGTGSVTITGAGSHYFIAYFDHEIDELDNTYFNEVGSTSGVPVPGQSWEIDEPGYVNDGTYGDIYNNVEAGMLDNKNFNDLSLTDDVSMALGWNFTLASDETAIITLLLDETAPAGSFYLAQTDPAHNDYSGGSVYFSGELNIRGGGTPIPEPGTLMLLGSGLLGLIGLGRKRFLKG
jgi:hypothetical protein